MKASFLIFVLLFTASTPSFAVWSCVNKDGKLLNCDSPSYCAKYFPSCEKMGPISEEEEDACEKTSCAVSGTPVKKLEKAPAPHAEIKITPPVLSKPAPPPEKKENTGALASDRTAQLKAMIFKAKQKNGGKTERPPAGLTPEEERKLFGGEEPAEPNTWSSYMSDAVHKHWIEELRKNRALREELRKRLADMPTSKPEDKDTKTAMSALIKAADNLESVDPLSSKEAFQLDENEVEEMQKRGATK